MTELELRDRFAQAAMQSLIAQNAIFLPELCQLAYKIADEMLRARKKW